MNLVGGINSGFGVSQGTAADPSVAKRLSESDVTGVLKMLETALRQAFATTHNNFLKCKLGQCAHVIAKIDLSGMSASALKQFEKKAEKWLKNVQLLAKKAGDEILPGQQTKLEQKIDAVIQKADEDLREFAHRGFELPEFKWDTVVMQARQGEKVPKGIVEKFPEVCRHIFQERARKDLEGSIPPERLNDFRKELAAHAGYLSDAAQILKSDKHFDVRMEVICMDILIDDLVIALEHKFNPGTSRSHQPKPPQIVKLPNGKFVLEQEPVIENLCLRGGGGKGFGYAGALASLAKAGKLDHLKAVSGSSAGAIAAAAVGFGIPYDRLGDFCSKIQEGVSRQNSKAARENYPAIQGMFSGIGLMGDAAGIIQAVDEETTASVRAFLGQGAVDKLLKDPKLCQVIGIDQAALKRLQSLASDFKFPRQESDMLTFHDLELLRKIQGEGIQNPFKDIILTGWDATAKKEVYFCAQTPEGIDGDGFKPTPSMPIAYAVRISMALPGAFKSVEMDLTRFEGEQAKKASECNGAPHRFMDGGLGSNSPVEAFVKPLTPSLKKKLEDEEKLEGEKVLSEAERVLTKQEQEDEIRHQRAQAGTLNCLFDEGGEGFRMDASKFSHHENPFICVFLWLFGAIRSAFDMNQLRNRENEKLDQIANNFIVGHGQLGTLSMSPSPEERAAADLMSSLMAIDWCRQRGEYGTAQIESFSLGMLLRQLSPEELQQLQTGGSLGKLLGELSPEELQGILQELPAGDVNLKGIEEIIQEEIKQRKAIEEQ